MRIEKIEIERVTRIITTILWSSLLQQYKMGATLGKNGGHFLDALPTQNTVHVVMLGLDSAGKTTALYRLKFDQYLNTVPTIGFNCEKVHGTLGKAKGVQFLVWDVGGQEKLRPLWRSYTRCTDGILFVVDSVDIERMEEAKMELMRTAKCPDNQGVPVLILANKQDLPGAQDTQELEKLLGLHELLYYSNIMMATSSTYNMNAISSSTSTTDQSQQQQQINKKYIPTSLSYTTSPTQIQQDEHEVKQSHSQDFQTTTGSVSTPTTPTNQQMGGGIQQKYLQQQQHKCWFIQPACAITGEGLQEGLEALYEMIQRRRKINKVQKRRR